MKEKEMKIIADLMLKSLNSDQGQLTIVAKNVKKLSADYPIDLE
jgi:glycine/serine hydroxymethyltransferase